MWLRANLELQAQLSGALALPEVERQLRHLLAGGADICNREAGIGMQVAPAVAPPQAQLSGASAAALAAPAEAERQLQRMLADGADAAAQARAGGQDGDVGTLQAAFSRLRCRLHTHAAPGGARECMVLLQARAAIP